MVNSSTSSSDQPLDCAIVSFYFPPMVGGLEFYLERLATAASGRISLVVLGPRYPGARELDESLSFDVIRRPMLAATIMKHEWLFKPLYPVVCFLIFLWTLFVFARNRPKMICAASGDFAIGVGLAAWLLGTKFSWICFAKDGHVRPGLFAYLGKKLPLNWVMRRCDVCFVISRYAWDILDPERRHEAKTRLLRAPIDTAEQPAPTAQEIQEAKKRIWSDEPEAELILSVGRLRDYKGFQHVIEAVGMLKEEFPRARYAIVGSGPYESELRACAERHGLADRVVFLGVVASPNPYYAIATAFATVSWAVAGEVEGFGMVFLEAGCFGVPSVAGDSGGMPEAVLDGESGFCVPGRSPRDVADALRVLLGDRERRRRMGERARAHALEFSPGRVAEDFIRECGLERAGGEPSGAGAKP